MADLDVNPVDREDLVHGEAPGDDVGDVARSDVAQHIEDSRSLAFVPTGGAKSVPDFENRPRQRPAASRRISAAPAHNTYRNVAGMIPSRRRTRVIAL